MAKADQPSTEVATRFSNQEVETFNPNVLNAYADLFGGGADSVAGHDLLKDELFDELVGVPFAVTRMTFRPGKVHPVTKVLQAYTSFEGVIAPQEALDRRKVNMSTKPFRALDSIVLNDGSTGLYRDGTRYLEGKGYIVIGHPELPEDGPKGECRYDLPPHMWEDVKVGEGKFGDDGFFYYSVNVRFTADRGIRISTYENEYTDNGKTRYFA